MLGLLEGDFALIDAVNDNISTALYVFFEKFPLASLLKVMGMVLISSFIITSADSGALVVDSITSGGNKKTPAIQRILWASLSVIIAAALLTGGGLDALQAAVTISGLPFVILLVLMCISLFIGIREDYQKDQRKSKISDKENYVEKVKKVIKKSTDEELDNDIDQ